MKFVKCSNYKREEDEHGPGLKGRYGEGKERNKKVLKLTILDHRDHAEKWLRRGHDERNTQSELN